MAKLSSRLSAVLTAELIAEGADTPGGPDLIVVAALGRALARTVGPGTLSVRVDGEASPVHCVDVECSAVQGLTAAEITAAVRRTQAGQPDALVSFRSTVSGTSPEDGYLLALHTRLGADVLYLDWHYDARGFDRVTIEELDEQFGLALIAVTSG